LDAIVVLVGVILAACAGMVNVIASKHLGGFVSHVSGTVSKVGMHGQGLAVGSSTLEQFGEPLAVVGSFIFGAMLCGLLAGRDNLHEVHIGRTLYGMALLGNAALLVATVSLAGQEQAIYVAATACGLQNGMCTMHLGAICRTTHVTGLSTDIGTTYGRLLSIMIRSRCQRKLDPHDRLEFFVITAKLRIYHSLGFGFLFGSYTGAWLSFWMNVAGLYVPAGITFFLGVLYLWDRKALQMRQHEVEGKRSLNPQQADEVCALLDRTALLLGELGHQPADGAELPYIRDVLQSLQTSLAERYRADADVNL